MELFPVKIVYLADLFRNEVLDIFYPFLDINSSLSTKEIATMVAPTKIANFLAIAVCLEDSLL